MKLMATAAPMPGTEMAARNPARSIGEARRRDFPRRSGGSDSGKVRKAISRLIVESPAATSGGSIPSRPKGWNRDSSPPMKGPKMKPSPKEIPTMAIPRARRSGVVTSAM